MRRGGHFIFNPIGKKYLAMVNWTDSKVNLLKQAGKL